MFQGDVNAAEALIEQVMPGAGTISTFNVRLNAAPGGSTSYTFLIRRNNADTAVTCTITGSATSCADDVNSAGFLAGDLVSVRVAPSGGPSPRQMRWTARFTP
jgi:hypothetical protein